jgi:hypothetical protein
MLSFLNDYAGSCKSIKAGSERTLWRITYPAGHPFSQKEVEGSGPGS